MDTDATIIPGPARRHRFALSVALLAIAFILAVSIVFGPLFWSELLARFEPIQGFAALHPAAAAALYAVAVAVATLACLPVGPAAAIIAGALFGTACGAAAAIGATVAGGVLLSALARRTLGRRLDREHATLLARLRRDGFLAVLALRIAPVTPGWLISVAAGSAGLPLAAFALASAIGILPAFALFARLGEGLGAALHRGQAPALDDLLGRSELLALITLAALIGAPVLIRAARRAR